MKVKALPVLAGIAGTLVLTAGASADFVTFNTNAYIATDSNGDTWSVIDLFACHDDENDVVLNIFDVNGGNMNGSSWYQADFPAAGLDPTFAAEGLNNQDPSEVANPDYEYDSFVTIGQPDDGSNASALDPNFAPVNPDSSFPMNAGWFNSNPPNEQGLVNDDNPFDSDNSYAFLGRFTISLADAQAGETLNFDSASISWNQGIGTETFQVDADPFSQQYAVPAPGALALLGLAGLAGTRRRRA